MDRVTWRNQFSIAVPSGWKSRELDDLFELSPPGGKGAFHITPLRRTKNIPVSRHEGEELIDNFAMKNRLELVGNITTSLGAQRLTATAFLRTHVHATDEPLYWGLYCYVWPSQAILCSFCTDQPSGNLWEEARQIFQEFSLISEMGSQ